VNELGFLSAPAPIFFPSPRGLALAGAIYHANPRRVLKAMKLKAELLFLPACLLAALFFLGCHREVWKGARKPGAGVLFTGLQ